MRVNWANWGVFGVRASECVDGFRDSSGPERGVPVGDSTSVGVEAIPLNVPSLEVSVDVAAESLLLMLGVWESEVV